MHLKKGRTMTETTLVPLKTFQELTAQDLFESGELKNHVQKIIDNVKSIIIDPSEPKGRDEIKSLAYKVAQTKTHVDKCRKAYIEDKQKFIKMVNANCAEVVEMLQNLQDEVRKPVTDFENREKERVSELKLRLSMIENYKQFNGLTPIESINNALKEVSSFDPLSMEEFTHTAHKLKEEVLAYLSGTLLLAEEYAEKEAQRIKLEAQEKERLEKERIERIEREATERAEKEAAQKIKEAEERAEREKQAELDRQKREHEAEINRIEAEKKKEEEEQRKRESDLAHKKSVNITALESLKVECGIDEETGKRVITAIAMGKIPNVKINY